MRYALLLGRVCFSLIFIMSGMTHFQASTIQYAAAAGVPMAGFLVPAAGVMACVGGLMIALGYRARLGGLLIAAFLLPVTFTMHGFWTIADPAQRMMQQIHFMKNLSMFGGSLIVAYFGSGPLSLDTRRVPMERQEKLGGTTEVYKEPAGYVY